MKETNGVKDYSGFESSTRILQFVVSEYGIAQKELARALGVDQSLISRILKGKRNLTMARIANLATIVELPLAVLLWKALRPATVLKSKEKVFAGIDLLIQKIYPNMPCNPRETRKETKPMGQLVALTEETEKLLEALRRTTGENGTKLLEIAVSRLAVVLDARSRGRTAIDTPGVEDNLRLIVPFFLCEERDCRGFADFGKEVLIMVSVVTDWTDPMPAYPCTKCGRLYSNCGRAIVRKDGAKAFLDPSGNVIYKNNQGAVVE